ncbi:MAG: UDP-N-acetylglucosamine 1-carboxyvinyltransferase [SAR324 cluster bacterium]|nr:UDP-N-acetylglucosamine 1-carboxyvinyltransferase [SAR324 cluster bacterium]
MEKLIIKGQKELSGEFVPSGNKNEALSLLSACLLCKQRVKLTNVPNIGDIKTMCKIIMGLGAKGGVVESDNSIWIDASSLHSFTPNKNLSHKVRASFLLLAPLLVRFGQAVVTTPGGDDIGRRRLDTHFLALEKFGVTIKAKFNNYHLECKKLIGNYVFLDEASVMATENSIMMAVMAKGDTIIYNAACEPHVQSLCHMLNLMGAKIGGIASNRLSIAGVSSLKGVEYRICDDHIEIGSIIGMAAVTKSSVTIKGGALSDLGLCDLYFSKLGVYYKKIGDDIFIPKEQELVVKRDDKLRISKIDDAPWPGFPTDLLSIMLTVATQCRGSVLIFEKLFESRLFWVDKIIAMGAEVILCDPHRALVTGPSKLYGGKIISPDIRAGMALLIAALVAEGESEIYNIEQIDRGYENIDKKLRLLGADIKRVSFA